MRTKAFVMTISLSHAQIHNSTFRGNCMKPTGAGRTVMDIAEFDLPVCPNYQTDPFGDVGCSADDIARGKVRGSSQFPIIGKRREYHFRELEPVHLLCNSFLPACLLALAFD